jgi:hypothetical protein
MKKSTCALCLLLLLAGCDFSERMPAEMTATSQSRPLEKEKALESTVRFDIGSLEITSGKRGGSLFSYDLEYDKAGFAPEFHYSAAMDGTEGKLTINLQSSRRKKIHPERLNNRLRLALSDSIPLTLKIRAGVGDARLALSNLKISKIDFESGVGEARLSAYEPNVVPCELVRIKNGVGRLESIGLGNLNFRDLEFEGGVGGANLDFSGEWKQDASVKISVGVGGVNVRMPREIGVRVEAEKNWLSGLHLEGFNLRGSDYYSENYDKAAVRVSVRVTTGIGGFRINWL